MYKFMEQLMQAQRFLKQPGIIVRETRPIPKATRRKWMALKGKCCAYCDARTELTLDHKLARSLGGTNHLSNIQVLCLACNRAKNKEEMGIAAMLKTEQGRQELRQTWAALQAQRQAQVLAKKQERARQRELVYQMLHGQASA